MGKNCLFCLGLTVTRRAAAAEAPIQVQKFLPPPPPSSHLFHKRREKKTFSSSLCLSLFFWLFVQLYLPLVREVPRWKEGKDGEDDGPIKAVSQKKSSGKRAKGRKNLMKNTLSLSFSLDQSRQSPLGSRLSRSGWEPRIAFFFLRLEMGGAGGREGEGKER